MYFSVGGGGWEWRYCPGVYPQIFSDHPHTIVILVLYHYKVTEKNIKVKVEVLANFSKIDDRVTCLLHAV